MSPEPMNQAWLQAQTPITTGQRVCDGHSTESIRNARCQFSRRTLVFVLSVKSAARGELQPSHQLLSWSVCYNAGAPETGWHIDDGHLFLTGLEAGSLRSAC